MTVKPPAPPPLPAELERLVHRLRLPYVRRAAPDVIATATSQRWEHAEVLKVLLAEEASGRDQATIRTRRRASNLPAGKTFDAWEPERSVIPSATQHALRTLEWIDRHEVLCVCGPSGTGKSHFIEAIGHLAIDKGRTVAWHTPETLAQLLRRHRVDDSVNKAIGKLIRVDLVVVDDVGLLPTPPPPPRRSSAWSMPAYEKRSIAISSNIHPSGYDELMPKSLATATVERLLHHAHVLITDGQDSYRLAQATAGKGSNHSTKHRKQAFLLAGRFVAASGEKRWPPVGEFVADVGENSMAIDTYAVIIGFVAQANLIAPGHHGALVKLSSICCSRGAELALYIVRSRRSANGVPQVPDVFTGPPRVLPVMPPTIDCLRACSARCRGTE